MERPTNDLIEVVQELARAGDLPAHLADVELSQTATFADLGIDSLGALAIVEALEERIGRALPDDFVSADDTLATLGERAAALTGAGG